MNTDHPSPEPPGGDHRSLAAYEIHVAGHLAPRWSAWFDGLAVIPRADGTTVLAGPVVDQAALHGLLQKLRDLGIPLLSLTPIPIDTTPEPLARTNPKEP